MTAALLSSNGKHINPFTTVLNGRKKKWPRVTAPGQLEKDETVAQEDLMLAEAGCWGSNKYLVGAHAGAPPAINHNSKGGFIKITLHS